MGAARAFTRLTSINCQAGYLLWRSAFFSETRNFVTLKAKFVEKKVTVGGAPKRSFVISLGHTDLN